MLLLLLYNIIQGSSPPQTFYTIKSINGSTQFQFHNSRNSTLCIAASCKNSLGFHIGNHTRNYVQINGFPTIELVFCTQHLTKIHLYSCQSGCEILCKILGFSSLNFYPCFANMYVMYNFVHSIIGLSMFTCSKLLCKARPVSSSTIQGIQYLQHRKCLLVM